MTFYRQENKWSAFVSEKYQQHQQYNHSDISNGKWERINRWQNEPGDIILRQHSNAIRDEVNDQHKTKVMNATEIGRIIWISQHTNSVHCAHIL